MGNVHLLLINSIPTAAGISLKPQSSGAAGKLATSFIEEQFVHGWGEEMSR